MLSVHVRVLVEWPLWRSWASLAGLPVTDSAPVPSHCRELIPSLLSDPIALLLKFILLAPLHLDQGEYLKKYLDIIDVTALKKICHFLLS